MVAIAGAGALWLASPAGRAQRLARLSDADLVSRTARDPQDADALLELARRMERQGLNGEALADYRRAAGVADPRRAADAWSGVARLALQQNDPQTAHDAALAVVKAAPRDAGRLREAGQVLLTLGDHNAARDVLQKAVALAPGDAAAWDALAAVQTTRGSLADALQAATRATQLAPNVAGHWLRLATARRLGADPAGAADALARAVRMAPDDPDILLEQGTLRSQTARTPAEQSEAEQALRQAQQRLRGTPREIEPLRQLGQFYLDRKRLPDAQTAFEQCLRLAPNDGACRFALGRTLALRGRPVEAAALLKRFTEQSDFELAARQLQMRMQREPSRADLPARLGDLLAAHGHADAARAAWQKSLQINPNQPRLRARLGSP